MFLETFFNHHHSGTITYILLLFMLSTISLIPPIYVKLYYEGKCSENTLAHFHLLTRNLSYHLKADMLSPPTSNW